MSKTHALIKRLLAEANKADDTHADLMREAAEVLGAGWGIDLAGHAFDPADLLRRAVRNIAPGRCGKNGIFWAKVRDTFAVGSTVACALCRWAGLDPYTGKEFVACKLESEGVS